MNVVLHPLFCTVFLSCYGIVKKCIIAADAYDMKHWEYGGIE